MLRTSLRKPLMVRCCATPNGPKPIPPCMSKRDYLLRKAERIRVRLAILKVNQDDGMEELMSELAKVREDIRMINLDPLTYDICEREPWIDECKLHDN